MFHLKDIWGVGDLCDGKHTLSEGEDVGMSHALIIGFLAVTTDDE